MSVFGEKTCGGDVRSTVERSQMPTGGWRDREVEISHLTAEQTLPVAMRAETLAAMQVPRERGRVFQAPRESLVEIAVGQNHCDHVASDVGGYPRPRAIGEPINRLGERAEIRDRYVRSTGQCTRMRNGEPIYREVDNSGPGGGC